MSDIENWIRGLEIVRKEFRDYVNAQGVRVDPQLGIIYGRMALMTERLIMDSDTNVNPETCTGCEHCEGS